MATEEQWRVVEGMASWSTPVLLELRDRIAVLEANPPNHEFAKLTRQRLVALEKEHWEKAQPQEEPAVPYLDAWWAKLPPILKIAVYGKAQE